MGIEMHGGACDDAVEQTTGNGGLMAPHRSSTQTKVQLGLVALLVLGALAWWIRTGDGGPVIFAIAFVGALAVFYVLFRRQQHKRSPRG